MFILPKKKKYTYPQHNIQDDSESPRNTQTCSFLCVYHKVYPYSLNDTFSDTGDRRDHQNTLCNSFHLNISYMNLDIINTFLRLNSTRACILQYKRQKLYHKEYFYNREGTQIDRQARTSREYTPNNQLN